jgi:signal transduction histidine kinase/DNA-binding response OmpR family regulator
MVIWLFCCTLFSLIPPAAAGMAEDIGLTAEEKEFIKGHPVIRLGVDPTFIPYEFIDSDGTYKGIAADYIDLICTRTGLAMIPATGLTWSDAHEKAANKELDVLPCISRTPEREKYFLFSDSYYTFQRVIFIHESNNAIKSFDDLIGKRVAVQAPSSHQGFLQGYQNITLSPYKTVPEALQAVSAGREEAFVGNLTTSVYLARANGITNLKYVSIYTDKPQELYFAVRNDWPQLISILNKALRSIDTEEKVAINNKWIGVQKETDNSGLIRVLVIIGAIIMLVLTVSLFWIIRLRREIAIRKKTQEELKAAKDEAEQANQIKSLFLARMSHEIRTPLSAITGMSYLIKKTGVTATQNIYLDKLNQAARNMLGVINDILDFSRIESGKVEIENISFELDKVLERMVNILSIRVEEKGIEFAMVKEPDMPSFFLGDPARIEQILINLLSNAVKFTEKGSVTLSVHTAGKEDSRYLLEFTVKDTGIGMHETQVSRLFIPFDQGDSSISRRYGGTGLGLSIVKSLTDMMGGSIEVHSVLNEGSVFCVRLPLLVDTAKEQTVAQKMASDCFIHIRALVLDKSENTSAVLSDCLRSFGIAADAASSEEEAVQLMRKSSQEEDAPYNLLLVDHTTPRDGGIAFLGRARKLTTARQPFKSILIVPMAREDLFDEIEAAGIDFGIARPIIPSVLYNGIIEIFSVKPPKPVTAAKEPNTLTAPYPYHILLVEDNKTNQFIAKTILEQAGFRVSKAGNGQEACAFFADKGKDLDLILMDIHMPVMNGYDASDIIRKTDKEIPIVAMTADAVVGVEEKCKSHGIYHYVSKPFEPEQFIATILDLLKGKKGRASEAAVPKETVDVGPVLDIAGGIRMIGGNEEIYRMVLQEYRDENNSVALELQERMQAKDYSQAVQIVHKIKGTSGSIGAKRLFDAASQLQKSLQSQDEKEASNNHIVFDKLLQKLMEEIDAYLNVMN